MALRFFLLTLMFAITACKDEVRPPASKPEAPKPLIHTDDLSKQSPPSPTVSDYPIEKCGTQATMSLDCLVLPSNNASDLNLSKQISDAENILSDISKNWVRWGYPYTLASAKSLASYKTAPANKELREKTCGSITSSYDQLARASNLNAAYESKLIMMTTIWDLNGLCYETNKISTDIIKAIESIRKNFPDQNADALRNAENFANTYRVMREKDRLETFCASLIPLAEFNEASRVSGKITKEVATSNLAVITKLKTPGGYCGLEVRE